MAPQRKGGRLIAAGVLSIISAVVTALAAIGILVVLNAPLCSNTSADEYCRTGDADNLGFIMVLMMVAIVSTICLFIAGVGGCMRRYWGQRALVILGSIGIALDMIAGFAGLRPSAVIVHIVFQGVVIGLAQANKRPEYELPH